MRPIVILLSSIVILAAAGCTRRDTTSNTAAPAAGTSATDSLFASVPANDFYDYDPGTIESGRLDTTWHSAAERDLVRRRTSRPDGPMIHPRSARADSAFGARTGEVTGGGNALAAIPGLPRLWIGQGSDSLPVLTLQVWLDHVEFSPGVIDGRWGKNTAKALYWFQEAYGLEPSGNLDPATFQLLQRLSGTLDPLKSYTVAAADVEGPFTPLPDDVYEKAKLSCLCHENTAEALGEKFHTTADFLASLNRSLDVTALTAGAQIQVPNVADAGTSAALADSVSRLIVSRDGFYLHAVDAAGNILYHFPSTLGSKYDPSPEGNLRITGIAFDPTFHYQPKLFADVPDTEPEAHLNPGPNSPVGLVWMQLSKENYGIHGTATPETIGYESSHGCIRLANWDALLLAKKVRRGIPVEFTEGSPSRAATN
jgi:lipoprotein-anchoring transpeptidase ErfK/SrfK